MKVKLKNHLVLVNKARKGIIKKKVSEILKVNKVKCYIKRIKKLKVS